MKPTARELLGAQGRWWGSPEKLQASAELAARVEEVLADKKEPLGSYAFKAGWYAAMEHVESLLDRREA